MINGRATEKEFNAKNVHGFGFNYAQLIQKELTNSASKGGLNNAKKIAKSIKDDTASTNNVYEITNLAGYGKGSINKTNFKPTIIDSLMYIQQPKSGYNNNRNLTILNSVNQNRKLHAKHNMIGTDPSLIVDTY